MIIRALLAFTSAIALSSCVSVKLGNQENKKPQNLRFSSPDKSYQEVFLKDLDYAWRDEKQNSTIGLFTECSEKTNKTLKDLRRELVSSLSSAKVLEEKEAHKSGFHSLRSMIEAKVDKKSSFTDLAIYQKANCLYIATHVTIKKQSGVDAYNKFLKSLESQL